MPIKEKMSPEFNYYITNGMYVNYAMFGLMALGLFINIIFACSIKSFPRFITYTLGNSFIIALIYLLIFFVYWHNLTSNVNNDADQNWVNDHDGGVVIILFQSVFGSLASVMIGLVTYVALILIKRLYGKYAQQGVPCMSKQR